MMLNECRRVRGKEGGRRAEGRFERGTKGSWVKPARISVYEKPRRKGADSSHLSRKRLKRCS
jgi:hypothetical protein